MAFKCRAFAKVAHPTAPIFFFSFFFIFVPKYHLGGLEAAAIRQG
jgi:hypothetical protein